MRQLGLLGLIIATLTTVTLGKDVSTAIPKGSIENFTLMDSRGKAYSLDDYQSSKLVVIAILGTECPLAKQSAIKLERIVHDYADKGVAVLGVDANPQDSLAEIAAFAKTNELTYPILKDVNQLVLELLGATRTPEIFVLDSNRKIRYHGRVDDQFSVGGKSRKAPTREDLKVAIDELLEDKPVSEPRTVSMGCLISRSRSPQADATVTYSNQVSRILQKHCVECHRPGEIAPFSLTDYHEVAGWADMIVEVTQTRQMPPWHASPDFGHFVNDRRISDEESEILRLWAAAGAPQGNLAELPPPVQYTEGWQLPKAPDQIVWMAETPYSVPADGTVKYQYFTVDPGFEEDKWVTAGEIIPGNRAVVHHVIVFMTSNNKMFDEEQQMVLAYVPGMRTAPLPKGMAKRIPKGSKLVFQMHYTPNGTAGEDRTQLGLVFAKPEEITHEVRTAVAGNRRFKIEPMKDDQAFESRPVNMPVDFQLLSLSPHMHVRGKSFRYELTTPDGKTETLLDVPHYDFNWQTAYRLTEPRDLPKGSKLVAYASFDNSPNNPANPDPTKTVTWGEQSWDEMLLGYFDIAIPKGAEEPAAKLPAGLDPKVVAKRIFESADKDKDGKISREETPAPQKAVFDKIDTDKDGFVTREELDAGLPELLKMIKF